MVNLNKIGDVLLRKRSEKDLSIEDLAHKTKINLNILKSLEANDLESLPNKTYVRGFVKNYARAVSMSTEEAMSIMEATYSAYYNSSDSEIEETIEDKSIEEKTPQSKSTDEAQQAVFDSIQNFVTRFGNKKTAITIFTALALVVSVNFVFDLVQKLKTEETQQAARIVDPTIKPVEANLLRMDATKKIAIKEVKNIQVETPVKPAVPSLPVAIEKKIKKVVEQIVEKKAEITIQNTGNKKFPYKKFYPAPRVLYTFENINKETTVSSRIFNIMSDDKQSVYISATEGDTYVSYQADDGPIKRFVLRKDRHILISAEKVILLFMGNINASRIIYNKKRIIAKSRSGVKSLIFPQTEASNYVLPLFPSYKGVPHKAAYYQKNMLLDPPKPESI